jgi:cellulose synthase/poly-beta-1,6-N-acetylglucosamine synthase-like glycosyltransferase
MLNLSVKHSHFRFSNEIALSTQGLARRNAGCVAKMRVSIVIPCYNEKDTIEKVVEAVRSAPLNT